MTLREKVQKLRERFPNIPAFDINGKNYLKPYVENIEGLVCNYEDEIMALKAEIIRLKTKPCDTCDKQNDGQFTGKCHICSSFYDSQYREK
jgi:hypothetical protein